jgi:uncharacterized GH25 family protein
MKKFFYTSFLFFLFTLFSSHEFWLQPASFACKKGDTIVIKFMVGENFTGENWMGNRSKINTLDLYQTGTKTSLVSRISDTKSDSLQFKPDLEGTAIVAYNSVNAFIEMDAATFNTYLDEEGLTEAIAYRKEKHQSDSSGREQYQRSVKTLLQVGTVYDSSFKQPTTLPLDIIPLQHPYLNKNKRAMGVRVLFNKIPLADQLIRIWYREKDMTIREEMLTNQDGIATFRVKGSGRWMVSTVKMIKLDNDPKAEWQSYWGSFTWGYE